MTDEELRAKFDDNASGFLPAAERDALASTIARTEQLPDVRELLNLACGP